MRPSITILILTVFCSALWLSAVWRSSGHFESGQVLERAGELDRALRHYQWAVRAYYPFSSVGVRALKRMEHIELASLPDHPKRALMALDLMRGAIRSTRWLFNPYEAWQERVDERIITLRSSLDQSSHRAALLADPCPPSWRSALLLLGVFSCLWSSSRLLSRGMTSDLRFTPDAVPSGSYLFVSIIITVLSL